MVYVALHLIHNSDLIQDIKILGQVIITSMLHMKEVDLEPYQLPCQTTIDENENNQMKP